MFVTVTTPATGLPFTIDMLRAYCRVLDDSDDERLTDMAKTAVEMIENITGRALQIQTLNYTFDAFASGRSIYSDFWYSPEPYGDVQNPCIQVPRPPLVSITSFKYYDESNVQRTLVENTHFRVDKLHSPGRLDPIGVWPATFDKVNAVELIYQAGYADLACPLRLSQAVKQLTAFWYDNPDAAGTFPIVVTALTDDYVVRYGK